MQFSYCKCFMLSCKWLKARWQRTIEKLHNPLELYDVQHTCTFCAQCCTLNKVHGTVFWQIQWFNENSGRRSIINAQYKGSGNKQCVFSYFFKNDGMLTSESSPNSCQALNICSRLVQLNIVPWIQLIFLVIFLYFCFALALSSLPEPHLFTPSKLPTFPQIEAPDKRLSTQSSISHITNVVPPQYATEMTYYSGSNNILHDPQDVLLWGLLLLYFKGPYKIYCIMLRSLSIFS